MINKPVWMSLILLGVVCQVPAVSTCGEVLRRRLGVLAEGEESMRRMVQGLLSGICDFRPLRLIFRVLTASAGCLLLATAWGPLAKASPVCIGNLSAFIGTTCTIGSLQYQFTNVIPTDNVNGVAGTQWTASDLTITPTAALDGFTLTFDGGPLSASTIDGTSADYAIEVQYLVSDPGGYILGENVSGGVLSSAGGSMNGDGSYQQGVADFIGVTTCSICIDSQAFTELESLNGVTTYDGGLSFCTADFPPCEISTAGADADPFQVRAQNGGSASWDGTPTTFTYILTNPASVATPEPGSSLVLGAGVLVIAFMRKNRHWRAFIRFPR